MPQPPVISVSDFRAALDRVVVPHARVPGIAVTDLTIRGRSGQNLAVRVYRPESDQPLPVVVWAHGGSFVRGTLDAFDGARSGMAAACACLVVAVDQRLAPEATLPAPIDDLLAAYLWAVDNASEHGGDVTRVGVGGESSVGNLAAAACLLARSRGTDIPAFQVLIVPLLDATLSSPSVQDHGDGFGLDVAQLGWAYEQYAPTVDRRAPLLSPLHEPDLTDLPRR